LENQYFTKFIAKKCS